MHMRHSVLRRRAAVLVPLLSKRHNQDTETDKATAANGFLPKGNHRWLPSPFFVPSSLKPTMFMPRQTMTELCQNDIINMPTDVMKHSPSSCLRWRLRLSATTVLLTAGLSLPAQHSVTADELMQLAETASRALTVSRQGLDAATCALEAAKAERLPDVTAEAAVGYLSNGILTGRKLTDIMHVDNPHTTNRIALRASQTIYGGGATSAASETARLDEDLGRLNLDSRRDEERFDVAMKALNWALLENRLRVVDHNIALLDTLIRDTQNRLSEGVTLETDLTRLRLTLETWRLERTSAYATLDAIRRQLGVTLHQDFSESKLVFDTNQAFSLPSADQLDHIKEPASTAVDVRKSALEVQLGEQRLRQAQAAVSPRVAVMV